MQNPNPFKKLTVVLNCVISSVDILCLEYINKKIIRKLNTFRPYLLSIIFAFNFFYFKRIIFPLLWNRFQI